MWMTFARLHKTKAAGTTRKEEKVSYFLNFS